MEGITVLVAHVLGTKSLSSFPYFGFLCCRVFDVPATKQSRTYSALSPEDILEMEEGPAEHYTPTGWGFFNKPVVPRWLAVILTSECVVFLRHTEGTSAFEERDSCPAGKLGVFSSQFPMSHELSLLTSARVLSRWLSTT